MCYGFAFFIAVLKGAIGEPQMCCCVQGVLIKARCLPYLLDVSSMLQRFFHRHAVTYGDVDIENRQPMTLPCRLPTKAQL